MWRKAEAIRDKIMKNVGTDEPWVIEVGPMGFAVNYRKPLTIEEVNQMAPTPDVKKREGRP